MAIGELEVLLLDVGLTVVEGPAGVVGVVPVPLPAPPAVEMLVSAWSSGQLEAALDGEVG